MNSYPGPDIWDSESRSAKELLAEFRIPKSWQVNGLTINQFDLLAVCGGRDAPATDVIKVY